MSRGKYGEYAVNSSCNLKGLVVCFGLQIRKCSGMSSCSLNPRELQLCVCKALHQENPRHRTCTAESMGPVTARIPDPQTLLHEPIDQT